MTAPRCILPGTTYLVTRRTTQRQFLLTPSPAVNEAFRYCAAHAAEQTGVELHALCVMSNHYHCICTDRKGLLPKFTEILHKLVSRCLNTKYGRGENLWSSDETSYVRLETEDDVLSKTVYALVNPLVAGLVPKGADWPGVLLSQPGRYLARRPSFFFREGGPMPERLKLTLSAPPCAPSPGEAAALVRDSVRAEEQRIRRAYNREGRRFLGASAVKAQSIYASPETPAPRGELSPRIACRDRLRRIERLQLAKEFVRAYADALRRWRGGERDVEFPAGVYRMRVLHGCRCVGYAT